MDRRKFLSTLGLGAAAAAVAGCGQTDCGPEGSADSKRYRWKLVTTWPKNYPGLGTSPERFAEIVKTMSNGRMEIKVFGANELVPPFEVFDAVSQGSAEMGHGAAYYWKGKHPAAPFFTAVPFGLTAQEMNGWLHHGGGQQLWDELYADFNLKPFAAGNTGTQMPGWYNKEINSVADLAGLKIRMPGLGGEVIKRAGAVPVQLPGGELFTALESGVIDAAEWVGPYNDLTFGFHRIAKFYYYPGWHEPGPTLELIINKTMWDELPEDLQAIIRAAAMWANQDMLDEYTARNNAALIELQQKHKVQLRRLPDDVLARLKVESDAVLAELVAGNEFAGRVYESFRSFEKGVRNYANVAELPYMNARNALAGCSDEPKPTKDPLAVWQPDLDEPIAEMENLLQTLNQQKHINRVAANLAVLHDARLYQLYLQRHAGLSGEARQEFESEQREWLKQRERTAREASDQFRSGSIASFIGSQAFIDETRQRTETLRMRSQKNK